MVATLARPVAALPTPATITALVDAHSSVSTEITGFLGDLEAACPACGEALGLGEHGAFLDLEALARDLDDALNEHLDEQVTALGPSPCAVELAA